eukprot:scaffold562955_cov31-Attheya_sp.AAC.1
MERYLGPETTLTTTATRGYSSPPWDSFGERPTFDFSFVPYCQRRRMAMTIIRVKVVLILRSSYKNPRYQASVWLP